MASYQQITIVGNLGSDPEARVTNTGVPVTSFSVAVNENWTGSNGEKQEKTTWFRVTTWRKLAEVVAEYLTAGREVMVIGKIEPARVFEKRDGTHGSSLEVTATQVVFLGKRENNGNGASYNNGASAPDPHEAPEEEEMPF